MLSNLRAQMRRSGTEPGTLKKVSRTSSDPHGATSKIKHNLAACRFSLSLSLNRLSEQASHEFGEPHLGYRHRRTRRARCGECARGSLPWATEYRPKESTVFRWQYSIHSRTASLTGHVTTSFFIRTEMSIGRTHTESFFTGRKTEISSSTGVPREVYPSPMKLQGHQNSPTWIFHSRHP